MGFWKYVKSYFSETTVHGFRYVAEGRTAAEKLLWVIFIAFAATCAGTLIERSLSENRNNPIITILNVVPVAEVPFPAVTVDGGQTFDPAGIVRKAWNRYRRDEQTDESKDLMFSNTTFCQASLVFQHISTFWRKPMRTRTQTWRLSFWRGLSTRNLLRFWRKYVRASVLTKDPKIIARILTTFHPLTRTQMRTLPLTGMRTC